MPILLEAHTGGIDLQEDAVAVRVWEVEACFSEPAILHEFRGEWEEIGRDNAVLLLGSGTLRFLMGGEDHEVVDAAPCWELKANAISDRTWCWRVFDRSAGEPKTRNFGLKFVSKETAYYFSAFLVDARKQASRARHAAAASGVG